MYFIINYYSDEGHFYSYYDEAKGNYDYNIYGSSSYDYDVSYYGIHNKYKKYTSDDFFWMGPVIFFRKDTTKLYYGFLTTNIICTLLFENTETSLQQTNLLLKKVNYLCIMCYFRETSKYELTQFHETVIMRINIVLRSSLMKMSQQMFVYFADK